MSQKENGVVTESVRADDAAWPSGARIVVSALVAVILAAAGGLALWFVFNTEPEAAREGASRETAMLVEVARVSTGTHEPTIVATGTVRPAREVVLRPRVEGQVTEHAAALQPGGVVEANSELVKLDASDYRQAVRQRRSDLEQAQAALKREQGRQRVAEREYELADKALDGPSKALALREPQLKSAKAELESARAGLAQARLELGRTRIEAPFDAQVLAREVDVGSQVGTGDALARLVGVETFWIEVTVPLAKLPWLAFPDGDGEGSRVRVVNEGAWPDDVYRRGRLLRLVGNLDEGTRMARALVAVDDPLARVATDKPRLILGTFVEARIQGRTLEDVVRLDRDCLRSSETVWVMNEDGELAIRDVTIAVRDTQYAYIRDGLNDGDRVVTSGLATVQEGAPLRLSDDGAGSGASDQGADGS